MSDGNGSVNTGRPTGPEVAEWKANFGRVIAIEEPVEMVFRKPSRQVWSEFLEAVTKQKGTNEMAYRRLCIACCLYPRTVQEVEQIFEDYPGLSLTMGDEIGEIAGHKGQVSVKKL